MIAPLPPMPVHGEKPSKLSVAEAEFWMCADKMKQEKNQNLRAALLWNLAFSSRLRDLEDIRPAGGFKP